MDELALAADIDPVEVRLRPSQKACRTSQRSGSGSVPARPRPAALRMKCS
jgi:hypothetical protein